MSDTPADDRLRNDGDAVKEPLPEARAGIGSATPSSHEKNTQNWPTAWAVTNGDGSVYEAFAAHQHDEAVALAKKCMFGLKGPLPLSPLYSHPPADEVERLREQRNYWMRMAAAFDEHLATMRVMLMERPDGTGDTPTLTEAEREAVEWAVETLCVGWHDSDSHGKERSRNSSATLRGLLERLK